MTATIINHLGATLTGELKCWLGRRIVEIQTPDGARHIGRLQPDHAATSDRSPDPAVPGVSTVDGAQ